MSGVTTFATGFPVSLIDTSDRCLIGRALIFFDTYCRPNLVGPIRIFDPRANAAVSQNIKNDRGVVPSNAYFDPTAFKRVPTSWLQLGEDPFGTAARNVFHGPGINNFDVSIAKDLHFTERIYITPRVDFFNAWNHAQFLNPSGNVNSLAFSRVTRTRSQTGAATGGRVIQAGLRLVF